MTRKLESFFILSFVSDYIAILFPLPLTPVKPKDLRVFTQLHDSCCVKQEKRGIYMSVSVCLDQQ